MHFYIYIYNIELKKEAAVKMAYDPWLGRMSFLETWIWNLWRKGTKELFKSNLYSVSLERYSEGMEYLCLNRILRGIKSVNDLSMAYSNIRNGFLYNLRF